MKILDYAKQVFEGEDGKPSKTGIMLYLFLSTMVLVVLCVIFFPVVVSLFQHCYDAKVPIINPAIPNIPATFETFVEFIVGILVGGGVLNKASNYVSNAMTSKNNPPAP